MALFDAFLKLDGIKGEAPGGAIQLESFSWGVSNPTTAATATGGAGAGKPSFQDFSFSAIVGAQSPQLFGSAIQGSRISSATLTVNYKEQILAKFSDVFISTYKIQDNFLKLENAIEGSDGQAGTPTEVVSFSFGQVLFQVGGTLSNPPTTAV